MYRYVKKQKFKIGQVVLNGNKKCKITKIIQYFDKGTCLGFEYFYSIGNQVKVSIGYDLDILENI
jgi:hypothetical protein